jgi:hypothetical protein
VQLAIVPLPHALRISRVAHRCAQNGPVFVLINADLHHILVAALHRRLIGRGLKAALRPARILRLRGGRRRREQQNSCPFPRSQHKESFNRNGRGTRTDACYPALTFILALGVLILRARSPFVPPPVRLPLRLVKCIIRFIPGFPAPETGLCAFASVAESGLS